MDSLCLDGKITEQHAKEIEVRLAEYGKVCKEQGVEKVTDNIVNIIARHLYENHIELCKAICSEIELIDNK